MQNFRNFYVHCLSHCFVEALFHLEDEVGNKDAAIHYNNILFHKIKSLFPLHILKEDGLLFAVHVKDMRMAT